MLQLKTSVLGEEVSDDMIINQSQFYASQYAEYEDSLYNEASDRTDVLNECSEKPDYNDPEGDAYAQFFAAI